jgi:hypothetical protein
MVPHRLTGSRLETSEARMNSRTASAALLSAAAAARISYTYYTFSARAETD